MGMQTLASVIGSEQMSSSRRTDEFKKGSKRVEAGERASSSWRAVEFKLASDRVQAGEQASVGA